MRKLFQTEWHGILFSSFTGTSVRELADASFYNAFYRAFFERYKGYDDLGLGWRQNKEEIAEWLVRHLPDGTRVLSVGCGLGYIEQYLWKKYGGRVELHVQDYASEAHRWLQQVMPAERIHPANGEGPDGFYDLIYLSAVDYALKDDELIDLLKELRQRLRVDGELILVSASFLEESPLRRFINASKDIAKVLLGQLCFYDRGQFWGWMRSGAEYRAIMKNSGFSFMLDDFIVTPHQRTYWIKGATGIPTRHKLDVI